MFRIGCHLSVSKGYAHMGKAALSIGANVFQFFSRNPRGGKAKTVDPDDARALRSLAAEHGFGPLLVHAPYTLNVCSEKPDVREFAHMVLTEDLAILDEYLPNNLYNIHPGHLGKQTVAQGVGLLGAELNLVLKNVRHTTLLLETMTGNGMGVTFAQLGEVLDVLDEPEKAGVCLDTCHVWAAGYDIADGLDGVLEEFERCVGLSKLHAVHLNDSLHPMGSKKDRHAAIGEGTIGRKAFERIINHKALRDKSFYLETPHDDLSGWAAEIAMLKSMRS